MTVIFMTLLDEIAMMVTMTISAYILFCLCSFNGITALQKSEGIERQLYRNIHQPIVIVILPPY